jgi:hypothetical protein
MKLKSFAPFKNAADALENANDVSEGSVLYWGFDTDAWNFFFWADFWLA